MIKKFIYHDNLEFVFALQYDRDQLTFPALRIKEIKDEDLYLSETKQKPNTTKRGR